MPKSTKFQALEKIIADLHAAQRASIEQGRKDAAVGNVAKITKNFITSLDKTVLTEINEAGNLLILVITTFSEPIFSKILQATLDAMFTKNEYLEIEQQVIATMYATKIKGMNSLKLAATQNPEALAIILPRIFDLEEINRLQILTGMESQDDKTVAPYSRTAIENLGSKMASLTAAQRGQLLTARDDSDDAWNVIAYAASRKESELIKLVLLHMADADRADPEFLSTPTDSSKVNASIFLYILSQPTLVILLQQLPDLPTLKIMLTVRGEGGPNAVALALVNGNPKHLASLLILVKRLEVADQKEVLNQLTGDAKQQLAEDAGCPEDIKVMLMELLRKKPTSQQFFTAEHVVEASRVDSLQRSVGFLPIPSELDQVSTDNSSLTPS